MAGTALRRSRRLSLSLNRGFCGCLCACAFRRAGVWVYVHANNVWACGVCAGMNSHAGTASLPLPSATAAHIRRVISACQWACSHCISIHDVVWMVVAAEVARGLLPASTATDLLSVVPAVSRSDIGNMAESVAARVTASFVRFVEVDLASMRPSHLFVRARCVLHAGLGTYCLYQLTSNVRCDCLFRGCVCLPCRVCTCLQKWLR